MRHPEQEYSFMYVGYSVASGKVRCVPSRAWCLSLAREGSMIRRPLLIQSWLAIGHSFPQGNTTNCLLSVLRNLLETNKLKLVMTKPQFPHLPWLWSLKSSVCTLESLQSDLTTTFVGNLSFLMSASFLIFFLFVL